MLLLLIFEAVEPWVCGACSLASAGGNVYACPPIRVRNVRPRGCSIREAMVELAKCEFTTELEFRGSEFEKSSKEFIGFLCRIRGSESALRRGV